MTTSPIFRTGPTLELKLAPLDAERGLIEGYGSIFGGEPDLHGDIIMPGAYTKSLRERMPAMLWMHDSTRPIGRWTEAVEDQRGLRLTGFLNLETQAGREAHAHVKAGDVTGLSIGYEVPPGGASLDVKSGVRSLAEIDLHEVSPVAIPAHGRARITGVKSIASQRELQTLLHETGLPRAAAAKIAAAGWPALNGDEDHPDLNSLGARIKAATAEIRSMKG
ncbi:HK97 family phage prohead protease [uncultured Brevundimonas sp.]|uniref:HK97 family phage prohead protease n=1 Tax=uncultured Brevundimonas sp. TaxID=213418 RepID=UPI0025DB73D4|nr:HK97 family phage prohead protease [uncultured Brevundimonas sp.]